MLLETRHVLTDCRHLEQSVIIRHEHCQPFCTRHTFSFMSDSMVNISGTSRDILWYRYTICNATTIYTCYWSTSWSGLLLPGNVGLCVAGTSFPDVIATLPATPSHTWSKWASPTTPRRTTWVFLSVWTLSYQAIPCPDLFGMWKESHTSTLVFYCQI